MLGSPFLRFALVGVAGFVVDAGVLWLSKGLLGPYVGRLLSFTLAVTTTWLLNRQFTFAGRQSGLGLGQEFGRYFSAMIGGGIVNYFLYAILIFSLDVVRQWPTIGVAAGSLAGLMLNFALSKNWIFNQDATPKD